MHLFAVMLQPFDSDLAEHSKHRFMVQSVLASDEPVDIDQLVSSATIWNRLFDSAASIFPLMFFAFVVMAISVGELVLAQSTVMSYHPFGVSTPDGDQNTIWPESFVPEPVTLTICGCQKGWNIA